jgi:carbon-monoxide dehydrogenase medium subunit
VTTLAPFQLHRARSVAEASTLLDELGADAAVYAGGTELLLLLKLGFAAFGHLVDIKPIAELHALEADGERLRVGAAVTHRELERSPVVRESWPELVEMERRVANIRVRGTGSVGGNLAFADPHSDPATFLLAAGGSVQVGLGDQRRTLAVEDFVLGPYETALRPAELLCAIEVPALPVASAMAHERFAVHERPAATVSAWVRLADARVSDARVAVGSVGGAPVLAPGVAEAVRGQDPGAIDADVLRAVGVAAAEAAEPVSDGNGSADYKAALVATLAGRALREAAARAARRDEGGPR